MEDIKKMKKLLLIIMVLLALGGCRNDYVPISKTVEVGVGENIIGYKTQYCGMVNKDYFSISSGYQGFNLLNVSENPHPCGGG